MLTNLASLLWTRRKTGGTLGPRSPKLYMELGKNSRTYGPKLNSTGSKVSDFGYSPYRDSMFSFHTL